MAIQLLSNLNYPIGNIINVELQNAEKVQIAVAFLKYTGVKVIEKSLKNCLSNKGEVEIIAGLDFKTTDPKSIHYFINLKKEYSNMKFYCFGDKKNNRTNIVFHPKIYLFEKGREKTGIVGSTNLTGGGLLSNFEVNTVFREKKPIYYSQLQAIYNSVKFTDSVFSPDKEYLLGYSEVYKKYFENESKAAKDKGIQKIVKEIQKKEEFLPGTVPSLKSLIIEVINNKQKALNEFVKLSYIYEELEKIVVDEGYHYKIDTFRNSIRGELNKHEDNSKHPDNMHLFMRDSENRGYYSLTKKGRKFSGR